MRILIMLVLLMISVSGCAGMRMQQPASDVPEYDSGDVQILAYQQIMGGDYSVIKDAGEELLNDIALAVESDGGEWTVRDLNRDGIEELILSGTAPPLFDYGVFTQKRVLLVLTVSRDGAEVIYDYFGEPPYTTPLFLRDNCLVHCRVHDSISTVSFTEYTVERDFSQRELKELYYYYGDEETSEPWNDVLFFRMEYTGESGEEIMLSASAMAFDAWDEAFEQMTGKGFFEFLKPDEAFADKVMSGDAVNPEALQLYEISELPKMSYDAYAEYFREAYPAMELYGCYRTRDWWEREDGMRYSDDMHSVTFAGGYENVFFERDDRTYLLRCSTASEHTKIRILKSGLKNYGRRYDSLEELLHPFYVYDDRAGAGAYLSYTSAEAFLAENGFDKKPMIIDCRIEHPILRIPFASTQVYLDEETKRGCMVRGDHGGYTVLQQEDASYWEEILDIIGRSGNLDIFDNEKVPFYEPIIKKQTERVYDDEGRLVEFRALGILTGWKYDPEGEPDTLSEIKWYYRKDGTLEREEVYFDSRLKGTWYHSYEVLYDNYERPYYSTGYVTHGHMEYLFIYEDENARIPLYILKLDYTLNVPYVELIMIE